MMELTAFFKVLEEVGPIGTVIAVVVYFVLRPPKSSKAEPREVEFSAAQKLHLRNDISDPLLEQGREILNELRKSRE